MFYRKGFIIQNVFAKYKLWFEYSGIIKKKSFSTVVMQNIEKVFILPIRIMHTNFRSSHLEPSTLKKLHWISFLMKITYPRTAFLHYISRYVSVWIKQKNSFEPLRWYKTSGLLGSLNRSDSVFPKNDFFHALKTLK